ncbi:MAG TPA: glycosyltransferase family 2 protein [Candidatus Woesebacteria bacterium]|nr:glycosyltransferase family 2 protein [Candidatus Woesebacteria bacterium]
MIHNLVIYRLSDKSSPQNDPQDGMIKTISTILQLSQESGYLNNLRQIIDQNSANYALICNSKVVLPIDIEERVNKAIKKANELYGSDSWAVIGNSGIEMYSAETVKYNFDPLIGGFVIPNKSSIPHLATYLDTNLMLLNLVNLKSATLQFPKDIEDLRLGSMIFVSEVYRNNMLALVDSELFVMIDNQWELPVIDNDNLSKNFVTYWHNHYNDKFLETPDGMVTLPANNTNRKKSKTSFSVIASEVHFRNKNLKKRRNKINIGVRTTLKRIPRLLRLLESILVLKELSKDFADIKVHIAVNNTTIEEFEKNKKKIMYFNKNLNIECFLVEKDALLHPKVATLKEIVKRIDDDNLNFLWFVDDDDFVVSQHFKLVSILLNENVIFIGDSDVFEEEWSDKSNKTSPIKTNYKKTFYGKNYHKNVTGTNHIPICSVIYPIKVLKEIFNDNELRGGYQDDYTILLFAQKKYEIRTYPLVIAGISSHGKNITTVTPKYELYTSYTTFLSEIINNSFIPSTFKKFMEKSRRKEHNLLTTIHERNLAIIDYTKREEKRAEQEQKYLEREAYIVKTIDELRQQNQLFNSRSWRFYRNLQLRLNFLVKFMDKVSNIKIFRKLNTLFRVFKYLGISGVALLIKNKLKKTEDYPIDKFVVDYLHWQRVIEPKLFKKTNHKKIKKNIKFSIITPVWNIEPELLHKAIDSVRQQTYSNWELCLYDDASTKSETLAYLKELEGTSENINVNYGKKNLNISLATNEALKTATGDYVLFLDNDDMLSPNALNEIVSRIHEKPKTDVVYYDEDIILMNDLRVKPILKPDWSPETLDATMYIAHATYRKSLVDKLGGMRKGFEGSQDYDLILRARDLTDNIEHISKVLYHWRRIPGSTADFYEAKTTPQEAAIKALKESIKRRKLKAKVEKGLTAPSFRFKYKIEDSPMVSIIIPTRNMKKYLKRCIDSVVNKTLYKNYEIIIVNNQSDDEETLKYFEEIGSEKIQILNYDDEFNYSAINNFAVKQARGKHVILLNNDTEVIDGEWLGSMLEFSQQKDIGAVGALLYFPDDTIQHAGCAIGIGGVAGHFYKYSRMGEHHMNVSLDFPKIIHNVSAVTGACLMIKKDLYLEVGGLEEKGLKVAFNDIDFCLKVLTKGFRNIYTPFATMYHYESKSRGYDYEDLEKQLRAEKEILFFKRKWGDFLKTGDPYYNSNFTRVNEFGELNNS